MSRLNDYTKDLDDHELFRAVMGNVAKEEKDARKRGRKQYKSKKELIAEYEAEFGELEPWLK